MMEKFNDFMNIVSFITDAPAVGFMLAEVAFYAIATIAIYVITKSIYEEA